ncbi:MAG: hypothetical protein ACYC8V_01220 [Caulobacteraceae bacterium]
MTLAWGAAPLLALMLASAVHAQTAPDSSPVTGSGGYVDRLIDGGALAPLSTAGGDGAYDDAGPPRFLRIDAVGSRASGDGGLGREDGVAVNAGIETINYGTVSISGVVRADPSGGSLSIIQRGMPFSGGWIADNALGTVNTPQIDPARNQYRFYIPTFPIAGASTEWLQGDRLQLQASAGEPGLYDGLRLTGFHPLGGALYSAGARWTIRPHWRVGFEAVDAVGVTTPTLSSVDFGPGSGPIATVAPVKTDAASLFASLGWRDGPDGAQLNLVESRVGNAADGLGIWFDGVRQQGRLTQNYGAFRLGRDLSWGYLPIGQDVEGLYWRGSWRDQRWLLDGGLDAARPLSGVGLGGLLFTANVRYQLDVASAIGATVDYRRSSPDAADGDLFIEGANHLGQWRAQLDDSFENGDNLSRASIEETWALGAGARLLTSISATDEVRQGRNSVGLGGSVSGGGDLTHGLSWEGDLSYDRTGGAGSSGNLNANVGLTARLGAGWSLSAIYFDNRNQTSNLFAVNPIIPIPLAPVVTRSSAVFLSLRYEIRAGHREAPLAAGAEGGAGAISGDLFLDANGDGARDAGEVGAGGVTVLLDGRFAARTDGDGRFEFPLVAPGPHEVAIVADNLPLPWFVDQDGRRGVVVHARERVRLEIAAARMR